MSYPTVEACTVYKIGMRQHSVYILFTKNFPAITSRISLVLAHNRTPALRHSDCNTSPQSAAIFCQQRFDREKLTYLSGSPDVLCALPINDVLSNSDRSMWQQQWQQQWQQHQQGGSAEGPLE